MNIHRLRKTFTGLLVVGLLAVSGTLSAARLPAPPSELNRYLAHPQPEAGWALRSKESLKDCTYWLLHLKSQVWQGIPWEHDLAILLPDGVSPGRHVVLINGGGSVNPERLDAALTVARQARLPVALLLGVPRQPLFGGLSEDKLVAETFIRYRDTGDADWPLLFPMVKSVTAAMDAVQSFGEQVWGTRPDAFILSGASKRGWTTWLTAASGDPRVSAIAPMVIDMLNIPEQVATQNERLNGFSASVSPYTERGLLPLEDSAWAKQLWAMVDPWSYRARYKNLPMMILLANNDPYWNTDALNFYWKGLPSDRKYIVYTPNAGHDLRRTDANGKKEAQPKRALSALAAFAHAQAAGEALPKLKWSHRDAKNGDLVLEFSSSPMPHHLHAWIATSASRDFRGSHWAHHTMEIAPDGRSAQLTLPRPESGFIAFYADAGYQFDGIPLWLCTQLRIAGAKAGQ